MRVACKQRENRIRTFFALCLAICVTGFAHAQHVAVLDMGEAGVTSAVPAVVCAQLETNGWETECVSLSGAAAPGVLHPSNYFALCMPHAEILPSPFIAALTNYLRLGGCAVAIGGPLCGDAGNLPCLEILCPSYKTYTVSNTITLHAAANQHVVHGSAPTGVVMSVVCPFPRTRGLGSHSRYGRWVPLVTARIGDNECGAAFSVWHRFYSDNNVGRWALLGLRDTNFFLANAPQLCSNISDCLSFWLQGLSFRHGGTEKFSYQSRISTVWVKTETHYAGTNTIDQRVAAVVSRLDDGTIVYSNSLSETSSQPFTSFEFAWTNSTAGGGEYEVALTLFNNSTPVDEIRHGFVVLPTSTFAAAEQVVVSNGMFCANGVPWWPHGVNYWPVYSLNQDSGVTWLDPAQYDPEQIDADLDYLTNLQMNCLVLQYVNTAEAAPLNDLLWRARQRGMRVMAYLGYAYPLSWVYDIEYAKALVTEAFLASNATLFALDVAWEPHLGTFDARRQWDGAWTNWVVEQYGSIASAEADWGYNMPKSGGAYTGPIDTQLTTQGSWHRLVAAYRRFVDDLAAERFAESLWQLRGVAPHQLYTSRNGYGGTGMAWPITRMPLEPLSAAAHLDFVSIENWGLSAEDTWFAGIAARYARWAGNGKPVVWLEFGKSVYPVSDASLEEQAALYSNMYATVLDADANGSFAWWFPGGLRAEEGSDYGIIGPDRQERPVADVIRFFSSAIASRTELLEPTCWLTVDRDADVRGLNGIMTGVSNEYRAALSAGELTGLRTTATGSNSLTAPLLAVGGTVWDESNCAKFLNALFTDVEWAEDGTGFQRVENGDEILVTGVVLKLRVAVMNEGEVGWLAASTATGTVFCAASCETSNVYVALPHDAGRYEGVALTNIALSIDDLGIVGDTRLELRMARTGGYPFGRRFIVTVQVPEPAMAGMVALSLLLPLRRLT